MPSGGHKFHRNLGAYFDNKPLFFDCDLQKDPNKRKVAEHLLPESKYVPISVIRIVPKMVNNDA